MPITINQLLDVERDITYRRVPKPIAVQHLFEWVHEPMVIAPDNLVTFDVGALRSIEDENRGDGKLCKTFAVQAQRRQFWALCLPVTGFCGTDPVAVIDEYSEEGQAG